MHWKVKLGRKPQRRGFLDYVYLCKSGGGDRLKNSEILKISHKVQRREGAL